MLGTLDTQAYAITSTSLELVPIWWNKCCGVFGHDGNYLSVCAGGGMGYGIAGAVLGLALPVGLAQLYRGGRINVVGLYTVYRL